MPGKGVSAKWILGSHYLSTCYREFAVRGFRPINLLCSNAALFMEELARGVEASYSGSTRETVPTKKSREERLTWAFLSIIWSHGRKSNADDRVDMERLAEKFLDEHRVLIAEIALTHETTKATI